MDADGVKDVIYQSCLAMDDEKFDEGEPGLVVPGAVHRRDAPASLNVTRDTA